MGSTTSRGNLAQDNAKAELERDGWLVDMAVPQVRVRYNRDKDAWERKPSHDYFGCIDLIALAPLTEHVMFIQVTHPSGAAERVRKIRERIPGTILDYSVASWWVWVRLKNGWQKTRVYATTKESSVVITGSPTE